MAQQFIDLGATANDATGTKLREAFQRAQENLTELYGTADLVAAIEQALILTATKVEMANAIATAIANLIGGAPTGSRTLADIAARLSADEDALADLQSAQDSKADRNSPSLTGTPTAPTPPLDDDSQRLATTAFVQDIVAVLGMGGGGGSGGSVADQAAINNANRLASLAIALGG